MLEAYHRHVAERAKLGIPPLPLNAQQTAELCEILKNPPEELKGELLTLNEVLELSDTNPYANRLSMLRPMALGLSLNRNLLKKLPSPFSKSQEKPIQMTYLPLPMPPPGLIFPFMLWLC